MSSDESRGRAPLLYWAAGASYAVGAVASWTLADSFVDMWIIGLFGALGILGVGTYGRWRANSA